VKKKVPLEALTKKYSNFFTPSFQININGKDIQQANGIRPFSLMVEKATNKPDKFFILIEDPQL